MRRYKIEAQPRCFFNSDDTVVGIGTFTLDAVEGILLPDDKGDQSYWIDDDDSIISPAHNIKRELHKKLNRYFNRWWDARRKNKNV